jgi:hypothetical protein
MSNCETYVYSKRFSTLEQKLLPLITPVDMLLKYIFHEEYGFSVCEHILTAIFGDKKLDALLQQLIHTPEVIDDILLYVTDSNIWKQHYLAGIKTFVNYYRLEHKTASDDEDIDAFMSSIGTQDEITDPELLPESIRKESMLMENFMNFYVTHIGGSWVARGDNGFLRLTSRDFLNV